MAEPQRLFPVTSSTLLHQIQHGAAPIRELAMARFCSLYYPAVYGYARMRGLSVEDAQDQTQDFFVEVVRDGLLGKFNATQGSRLSSWLMTCFKHMELSHRNAQSAKKRGGGREFVSFDTDFAELCHQSVHAVHLTEASAVDLTLARSFWRSAQTRLRARYLGTANESLVNDLMPMLLMERWPGPPAPSQEEMATKHGTIAPRLKAFFNRTLKSQADRLFEEEARYANPGISGDEVKDLWALLHKHSTD